MHYQVQNYIKAVFGIWDHRSFVYLSIFAAQRKVWILYAYFIKLKPFLNKTVKWKQTVFISWLAPEEAIIAGNMLAFMSKWA